jgi:multidrug resistance efflux pump
MRQENKDADVLTDAIAEHNAAVANALSLAESSLTTAHKQLEQAEAALELLKIHIIDLVEKKNE